jgi:diguanylate cyclase (GGDEF)-like protein
VAKRLAILDPTGRLRAEIAPLAAEVGVTLQTITAGDSINGVAAILVAPAVAGDLGPAPADSPARWIIGDPGNAARVAGAAAGAGASGVLLTPLSVEAIDAIAHHDPTSPDIDLARARGLIATSLVDLTGSAVETLRAVADGFTANDCIVWWRDGTQMTPTAARPSPTEVYRAQIATASRIAAAASGTVITGGPKPRSVIAEALRSTPTEVAGLVAIVSDSGRRFSSAERTDLKAIGARLTRELSWLTSHRRIVAEGERLLAASLHDPLTGAMTRGAFEQTITHEVAAAGRRGERLTLVVFDVVGLRKINVEHGHRAGDEVLAQIAGRIRATVRGNDPIGRPGGDELAILLVNAPSDQARIVTRKLIGKLQAEPIRVDDSVVIPIQVRAVLTEIAAGERSGEAALARCYQSLRSAPVGDVRTVNPNDRPDTDPSADTGSLSAGTIVGGTYRVVHELSRGAMGVVYRGEDLGLGRAVAIKVLRSDLASDKDLVARFRAEAAILASLHHPNLVQVYALGEHGGEVYFVMELVEGQPLSEVLRATLERKEWFPAAAIAQITLEIADALDAMHERGLIHRDVKPANILLDRERDRAVLVDVGVAVKAGDARDAAGTPGFAAPESFGEQADGPTTDVYGLAAVVYSMLTGRPPFGAGPAPQVVHRQLNDPILPPSHIRPMSEAVDAVITKALAPQPKKRWASASTFAVALARALERIPTGKIDTISKPVDDLAKAAETLFSPAAEMAVDDAPSHPSKRTPAIPGRVRAAHLRVLSRLLQHNLGESGVARIVAEVPHLANALSATLAPLSWVELADLVSALERAQKVMPGALLPRKVGRGTMSATFAYVFGADPSSVAAETVLAALPTFWPRYHEWGELEVVVHPGSAAVTLHGSSGSVDVCAMVGAELERIAEMTGAAGVEVTHPRCTCMQAPPCEFRVTWMR